MADTKDKALQSVHLHYDKGELIMKEGDYGISIYKILEGHVRIFKDSGDGEIPLATLGPGEVFGEMTFLTKLLESRSASVRAVHDVVLEVWHPSKLSKEYDQMPLILKYIINQTLNRLTRMNKVFSQLTKKTKDGKKKEPPKEHGASQRRYYRKEFDKTCIYRPVGASANIRLRGRITDISLGGAGMDISAKNVLNFTHNPGDAFEISTTLPSGQKLDLVAKIKSVKKNSTVGHLLVGLEFFKLSGDSTKKLGFFMMR